MHSFRAGPGEGSNNLSCRFLSKDKLPRRNMLQLRALPAEIQLPAAAGCPIDGADGDLGREPQSVRRRSTGRGDGLAELQPKFFDHLLSQRWMRPEPALHWRNINASSRPEQLATPSMPRKRLIDSWAVQKCSSILAVTGVPSGSSVVIRSMASVMLSQGSPSVIELLHFLTNPR